MGRKEKKLVFLWVLSAIISLVTGYNISNYRNTDIRTQIICDTDILMFTIDSLKNESFIQMTIIDRYEIALENLRVEDSISAEKFEQQLNILE